MNAPARFLVAALALLSLQANATVMTFFAAGETCSGGSTVSFSETGANVKVSLCATTTVEGICGASIYPKLTSAAGDGHFQLVARTLGTAIPDSSSPISFPQTLNATADFTQNFGGSRTTATSPGAAANQLLATFEIDPQVTATNASYVLTLDAASEINHAPTGLNCFTDFTADSISPSITLTRGTTPQFSSANSTIFTVGFSGNFQVVADGTPAPTLTLGGQALPANLSFTPATGMLAGTPQLGKVGTYNLTFTAANGNLPNATQNFTLIIQKANQAINFDPLADRNFSTLPFTVTAASSLGGGYPVTFASSTPGTCSVSTTTVTMLAAGTCTVAANQAGDANYNAATVSRSFQISAVAPAAPVIGIATAGNTTATASFTAPMNSGGAPIQYYTATCGSQSATGMSSPITVTGLANGTPITCSVTAFNGTATSVPSSPSNSVTPVAQFTVTPSVGANGSVSPNMPVTVNQGNSTSFMVSPNAGYVASVSGCGGTLIMNTYTTASITTDCTVTFTFVALVTFNVALEGAQETPALAVAGTGGGTAVVNTVANTIALNLSFSGLTGAATAAHLHGPAVRGTPAGVKITIGTTSPITNTVTYSESDEADILAGRWYVNIHTAANGAGELRGQLDNLGPASKTLTVATTGTGNGSVTGNGINCPGDCAETVAHNTVIVLTATPATGSTFTGWSGACSGTGTCSVTMDSLKSVTATFAQITYTVTPSAGTNGTISPSMPVTVNHGAIQVFTLTPAMGFTASVSGTCGGNLTGNTYTTNAITANCTVEASFNPPISLVRVESRKVHGAFTCNVPIAIGVLIDGNVSVETRDGASGHQLVFVFDAPVTQAGTASITPTGTATPMASNNEVLVALGGIADASRVTVSLAGVNGVANASASMGFLLGDVTGSRAVSAADISSSKARLNSPLSTANCAADVNGDGQIKSSDVSLVKSRSGSTLP